MTKAIKVFKNKPIIPLGFFLAVNRSIDRREFCGIKYSH